MKKSLKRVSFNACICTVTPLTFNYQYISRRMVYKIIVLIKLVVNALAALYQL